MKVQSKIEMLSILTSHLYHLGTIASNSDTIQLIHKDTVKVGIRSYFRDCNKIGYYVSVKAKRTRQNKLYKIYFIYHMAEGVFTLNSDTIDSCISLGGYDDLRSNIAKAVNRLFYLELDDITRYFKISEWK